MDILDARLADVLEKQQGGESSEVEILNEDDEQSSKSHLTKKRHKQRDFFVADTFDGVFKDDLASMEHPLFALKAGDTKDRFYEHGGNTLEIRPNSYGCATIHDKDLWIYCVSSLMAARNRGEEIEPTIRFKAYDFLVATNRGTGGHNYKLLREALERLAGTRIATNIVTGGKRIVSIFGLLDKVDIIYLNPEDEDSPMESIEVTLPDWLFRSVETAQIKTISPDYFRLRKPLDRRIYELCAKHCGHQSEWMVSLETLHKKSGTTAPLRNFRIAVKSLADSDELPDYSLIYDAENDRITVRKRKITVPELP
ncbi:MAG: replication initiator protein A [Neisseria animaloris]|nr:replication initiator protein A [Neisseria animaloris]